MDIDLPEQGLAVPGLPGQGIAVSALPSQELLAKLQLFCEGSLQAPQPTSSHLQVCFCLWHKNHAVARWLRLAMMCTHGSSAMQLVQL